MRFRLHKDRFTIDFSGSPTVWNECLRPYFRGPEAPAETLPAPAVQRAVPAATAPSLVSAASATSGHPSAAPTAASSARAPSPAPAPAYAAAGSPATAAVPPYAAPR